MIIEGSPVAVVQPSPTNGSSLLAGGQVLNSNQHFQLTLNYWCYYPFHSNCISTITGVPRASSTDVAPNQISGIDYLRWELSKGQRRRKVQGPEAVQGDGLHLGGEADPRHPRTPSCSHQDSRWAGSNRIITLKTWTSVVLKSIK